MNINRGQEPRSHRSVPLTWLRALSGIWPPSESGRKRLGDCWPMSRANVELVRRSFEAFARGDFHAAFSTFDTSIEWRTAADEPDQRTYKGIEELREFVRTLAEPWSDR